MILRRRITGPSQRQGIRHGPSLIRSKFDPGSNRHRARPTRRKRNPLRTCKIQTVRANRAGIDRHRSRNVGARFKGQRVDPEVLTQRGRDRRSRRCIGLEEHIIARSRNACRCKCACLVGRPVVNVAIPHRVCLTPPIQIPGDQVTSRHGNQIVVPIDGEGGKAPGRVGQQPIQRAQSSRRQPPVHRRNQVVLLIRVQSHIGEVKEDLIARDQTQQTTRLQVDQIGRPIVTRHSQITHVQAQCRDRSPRRTQCQGIDVQGVACPVQEVQGRSATHDDRCDRRWCCETATQRQHTARSRH